MKTAVSMPDDLFERTQEMAAQMATSRSRVICEALREYLGRHSPDHVTAALDAVVADVGRSDEEFIRAASLNTLRRNDW